MTEGTQPGGRDTVNTAVGSEPKISGSSGSSNPPKVTAAGNSDGNEPAAEDTLFAQELSEVYLLLDFISGRADRNLSELKDKVPNPSDTTKNLTWGEIISRVCALRFPLSEQQSKADRRQDAAFLLMLRDVLNSMADPARGLTIAYTIMFTEASKWRKKKRKSSSPEISNLSINRIKAAENAFPGLEDSATIFRWIKNVFIGIGVFITAFAALLLWEVTYGAQLATRFDQAKKIDAQTEQKVYEVVPKGEGGAVSTASYICHIESGANSIPESVYMPVALRSACNDYAYNHAVFCESIVDLDAYAKGWVFRANKSILPMHDIDEKKMSCSDAVDRGRQEDAQSVAGVLAILSNYFLPMLFGVAGTITAFIRSIQDKITDSILYPRDQALSLIRLPLGMVAGVSVGLFISSSNSAVQVAGNIGMVTISASGIAFLAGYGAEGFFRLLDTLIARLFAPEPKSGSGKGSS